jgi:Protein of unknown function (DUF3467)
MTEQGPDNMAKDKIEEFPPKEGKSNGQPGAPVGQPGQPTQVQLRMDTSNLKSTYCNVCNATSTREEVVLTFGVNQDWDLAPQMREVQLHHRIILSPFAAKRLQELITKLVHDHEARWGELK